METRRLKFWGWGYEDQGPNPEQQKRMAKRMAERFGLSELTITLPPKLDELDLRAPRVSPPAALAPICSTAPYDRAAHTYGKSSTDLVRAFRRDFRNPPDLVAFPKSEDDIVRLLDWCSGLNIVAIPYGGGSSVVGGLEPPRNAYYAGAVSIDLRNLNRVLQVDRASRAAKIQAGVFGPALEDQLRPHKYTLRHFPQSFEFSTLGGWIATRSGGHFATLYTHIDDFVESLRVITPTGTIESRRLPGSGAGPSPDRMFIGSEGTLGIITEAWMRLQDRPTFRAGCSVSFPDFRAGAEAARHIAQAGLYPANCRLLDEGEALRTEAGDGNEAILVLAFESADHELDAWIKRALEICKAHGGKYPDTGVGTRTDSEATHQGAAGSWRNAFLSAPYLMDTVAAMGLVSDTFETSITWDRFPEFHAEVTATVSDAIKRICGKGALTCRFTHVYPDGPAPYYTVLAAGRKGSELEQWAEIKRAASDCLIANGGTITHHHAVGRDHRPWYDQQRPDGFARAMRAAKPEHDPRGNQNPGVLFDPVG
jgi:alkyldihydroxyacetonephosphate synthase